MESEVRGDPPRDHSRWKCLRCKYEDNFPSRSNCYECGTHRNRIVKKVRRRKIGGKRGRNSGKVQTNK